ncbi:uncharacterized protein BYT42DRAFT_559634 [Radiomyces spectabilis]|uniref:uncharacterized protein n=1 Tax=Radiomyces spectabilis TaxID=64574 RepID=UPI00221E382F|nr:uncharacterized protein BYT42DRAFT_559634 [Radiomyces spectabilis]KAI8388303.1 hypothetical protein BYT42DRAFT_559634 [Radiomyces spectabilis]
MTFANLLSRHAHPNSHDDQSKTERVPSSDAKSHSSPNDIISTTERENAVGNLQSAFPTIEAEVIEAVLDSQNNKVEACFEVLLSMTDPSYESETAEMTPEARHSQTSALDQQTQQDELLARKLALEEQEQQQDQSQARSGFHIQEEIPVIKERVMEASHLAKKKVLDFYSSLKSKRSSGSATSESTEGPNASPALHTDNNEVNEASLSTWKVASEKPAIYCRVPTVTSVDLYEWDGKDCSETTSNTDKERKTSTSAAQLKEDEDLAYALERCFNSQYTRTNSTSSQSFASQGHTSSQPGIKHHDNTLSDNHSEKNHSIDDDPIYLHTLQKQTYNINDHDEFEDLLKLKS